MSRPLLLVRPEPGLSESLARATSIGIAATGVPLFAIRPLEWTAPDANDFDALLLTSANTLRAGGPGLDRYRRLPVLAVGAQTAAAARSAGFEVERVGIGGVSDLLADVPTERRLLHLGGRHRAASERPVTHVAVYESAVLSDPRLGSLRGWIVAVHSVRAARRLSELVRDRERTDIVALSAAVSEAVGPGWNRVEIAEEPTDESLLALAKKLCQTDAP